MNFMDNNMKIIAITDSLPIEEENALLETSAPKPTIGPKDLLVKINAVSINPVDIKVRASAGSQEEPKILGWDAAGIIEDMGSEVEGFSIGDSVYYAGDLTLSLIHI